MSIENIRKIKEEARMPKEKKRYKIPIKSAKRIAKEKAEKEERNGEQTELQRWYQHIIKIESPICWETLQRFNGNDKSIFIGSIAHILPKSLYPSVATHPRNYMILHMWNGAHANYDRSWGSASKMKIWSYALNIILNELYPLLTPEEKRKLPDFIRNYIE